ncbi:hypothetical protein T12_9862, partial [Trichinella patagoniensis]
LLHCVFRNFELVITGLGSLRLFIILFKIMLAEENFYLHLLRLLDIQLKEIEKLCGCLHLKNMMFQVTVVYSSLRRFFTAEEEN